MTLVSMTLFWGLSYHLVDVCVWETGTAGLTGMRFILAFFITAIAFHGKLKEIDKTTLWDGFLIGVCLSGCYQTATLSIQNTITSNAAFLCTLSLMIVPLIEFVLYRKRPPAKIVVTISIALVGIFLLTMGSGFEFGSKHLFGDLCGLGSSLFYAFDMVLTDRAVGKHNEDPIAVGICSIGWTGVIMLAISFAIHDISLPHSQGAIIAFLILVVFCSAYPFIMQPVAQRYTETSHVGIIITLEPVFASIFAFLLEGAVPSGTQLLGQILMFSSMLLLEIDLPSRRSTSLLR